MRGERARAGVLAARGVTGLPLALRVAAPLALMGLIFYLSAQSDPGPELPAAARIAGHASEFGLLCGLWSWALWPRLAARAVPAAAAISLLYAGSDEWHQSHVPGRDADPLDLVVDAAGIAAAAGIILALRRRREGRSRRTARRGPAPPA